MLKGRLKRWYKEISGSLDLKVDLCVSDLNELDRILVESDGTICKQLVEKRTQSYNDF